MSALLAVAQGKAPADTVVRGGRLVNVYSEEVVVADVIISHGRVARVGSADRSIQEGTQVIEAAGAYVLPGYMEPHCHPWSLYNPDSLARHVLPWGNTAFVGELLPLQLLLSVEEVLGVLESLQRGHPRWFWSVRIAGQSRQAILAAFPMDNLQRLLDAPGVVQLAETTSWPRILVGNQALLERMAMAKKRGLRVDGHGAGATAEKIASLAAAGFTADHESINLEEALERLRNGYHVMLRDSSLRPDLDGLLPLVQEARGLARLSVTSDGSGPAWLNDKGMIDGIVRKMVRAGVAIPRAVALASLNPATYLHLDEHLGGLAPGRCADLQVLRSFDGEPPEVVMVGGDVVARNGQLVNSWPAWEWQTWADQREPAVLSHAGKPEFYRPSGEPGQIVPVMQFTSAAITRAGEAVIGPDGWAENCVLAVLLSRDGKRWSKAWLGNFAPHLEGLATSYTTSCDYLVIGRDPQAMALAARRAFRGPGGIVVAEGGSVVAALDLEIKGVMSARPISEVLADWLCVDKAMRRAGYPFEELLFCLCFITCDFLPDLRLVADGLLAVKTDQILVPAEQL